MYSCLRPSGLTLARALVCAVLLLARHIAPRAAARTAGIDAVFTSHSQYTPIASTDTGPVILLGPYLCLLSLLASTVMAPSAIACASPIGLQGTGI